MEKVEKILNEKKKDGTPTDPLAKQNGVKRLL